MVEPLPLTADQFSVACASPATTEPIDGATGRPAGMTLEGADLTGLEKFTDMGFLSAAMRAGTMPPQDAWFAGFGVNYYYVGQAMAGAWGNLAGLPPDHTYQLAMATLFALTGLAAFRIAHEEAFKAIGWKPQVEMEEGLRRLMAWIDSNAGRTS